MPEPTAFDEEGIKKLNDEATASVPAERTNLLVVAQERNPLRIEGKETYLLTISYTLHGENFVRSICFLNRAKDQMRFQLTCRQADFKELEKAFQSSLFSWQRI